MRRTFLSIVSIVLAGAVVVPQAVSAPPPRQDKGFQFPGRVGLFVRQGKVKQDGAGDPVAHYVAGALVLATVYYYQSRGRSLDREFADCKRELKKYSPNARLISDGRFNTGRRNGLRAVYTTRSGPLAARGPAKSQLVIFSVGNRFLKYRITYLSSHAERAEREINSFIAAFPWPGG